VAKHGDDLWLGVKG